MGSLGNIDFVLSVFPSSTNSDQTVCLSWDLPNFYFCILYEMCERVQGVGLGCKSRIKFLGETTAEWEEAAECGLWRPTAWIESLFVF